jgi:hypothetical protein
MNLGTSTPTNFDASTSNVFFEAWINWTDLTGQQRVYGRYANPQATSSLNLYMRKLSDNTLQVSGGSGNLASNLTALSTGVWYHIAFSSIPGGSSYVFVNGVPGTGTSLTYTAHNATYNTYIGSGASQYLSGYIRDLRVVQGGIVPVATFTPGAAPFSYALPSYVTGSGSVVFTILGQFVTYNPSGKYGKSVVIQNDVSKASGNNGMVWNAAFNVDSGITISFWVKVQQIGANTQTLLQYSGSSGGSSTIIFSMNGTVGTVAMWFRDAAYHTVTSSALSVNTWNHLCLSVGTGNLTAYLNGVSQGATTYTPSGATVSSFTLGAYGGSLFTPSTGEYDDLRIYNTALTAARVQSVYSSQGAPAPSRAMPLTQLAWDFQSSNVDYVIGLSPSYSSINGALTNLPTYVSGKYNQGIRLTQTAPNAGANTYVLWSLASSPISIDTTGVTIACWVNWTTFQGSFVSMYDAFSNVLGIYMSSTQTFTGRGFSGTQALTNATSNTSTNSTGVWYHIALTYNSTAVILYRNGVGGTPVSTGPPSVNITGIRIGSQANNIQGPYNGYACADCTIDDLRVYNTALTSAQIQAIYNQKGMPGRGAFQNVVGSVKSALTRT